MGKYFFSLGDEESKDIETPDSVFDPLNHRYDFTLDPCSNGRNAKAKKFFTIRENGLVQSWAGERVFMNPPSGREIEKWVKKAYQESRRGALVVCLLPSRTDTNWWHKYCKKADKTEFLKGRVQFCRNGVDIGRAPIGSVVVVFNPRNTVDLSGNLFEEAAGL